MTTRFTCAGQRAEIWLYDQIGESFWGGGISADAFRRELTALGKPTAIDLHVNSPGGDVFDGVAIYNLLRNHPARIHVMVDGLAASIASIIAMAGDEITIAANARMMIHNPHGMAVGDAAEMQRVAGLLQNVKADLVATYRARTAQADAQLAAWMDDETWFGADAAVQYGFADRVDSPVAVTNCWPGMDRVFRRVPDDLRGAARGAPMPPHARDMAAVRVRQAARRLGAVLAT